MTTWLSKHLKADLEALADQAGLEYSKADNKATIASALDDHLRANASQYRSVPAFAEYFRTSRSISTSGEGKQRNRNRTTKTPAEIAELSPESPAAASAVSTPAPNQAAHRTPARARTNTASRVPLPPSPAVIAQMADRQTAFVTRRIRRFYRESGVLEYLNSAREALSTVPAIMLVFLAIELYNLNNVTMPWRHAFTVPALAFLGPYRISLPDMFVVLTSTYWAPTALWLVTSLIIPAAVGWLVNLTVAQEGRSTRRRAGYYAVDPLVFGVAKAAVTWLVYAKGVRFGGLVDEHTVRSVERAVPYGWSGIVIGSVIGVVTSFYEAILRK